MTWRTYSVKASAANTQTSTWIPSSGNTTVTVASNTCAPAATSAVAGTPASHARSDRLRS